MKKLALIALLLASPVFAGEGAAETTIATSTSSAKTGKLSDGWKYVYCTVATYYRLAENTDVATATTSDLVIPATTHYAVKITPNFRFIAFILGSSTGSCSVFPINVPPTALFIRPGTSGAAVNGNAITPASITASGAITGLSFTATQVSGSNAFIASTGARWKLGGGTTDYFSSNGTTMINAAGDFGVAGTLTAADFRPSSTSIFDMNSHVASGTTAFTLDASSDLLSGLHTSFRDNGTTALATISFTGAVQAGTVLANEVTLAGAASSSPVTVTASGSDTDVDVNVVPKGTGSLEVNSREVPVMAGTSSGATMFCMGKTALTAGVANVDFTDSSCEDFGDAPNCICGNTGNTTENACSTTSLAATGFTLNGDGTDSYTWICFGETP